MTSEIRLDFISDIDPKYLKASADLRKEFIALDRKLRELSIHPDAKKEGASRCLSLARTNMETACMYAIKSLCIMGENKEENKQVNNVLYAQVLTPEEMLFGKRK
jgi:hypothetical protein